MKCSEKKSENYIKFIDQIKDELVNGKIDPIVSAARLRLQELLNSE